MKPAHNGVNANLPLRGIIPYDREVITEGGNATNATAGRIEAMVGVI